MSLNYIYHLLNTIAEGVFERLPDLKFVWADGAADMVTPFIWRMDCFGRPHLEQNAVGAEDAQRLPAGHVYFIHNSIDGPGDADFADQWLSFTGGRHADVRLELPALALRRRPRTARGLDRRAAREESVLAQRRRAVRHRDPRRSGRAVTRRPR